MGTVYVIQNQHRLNRVTSELIPRFDFSSAEEFGEIEFLLSPTAAPWETNSIVAELRTKLRDFDANDSLLLVGNPILIGWAVAIAARKNGFVRCLQWSGKDKKYIAVEACL